MQQQQEGRGFYHSTVMLS